MDTVAIWRAMADKWLEIAQDTAHPALRKCYRDKALRFRAMAALAERGKVNAPYDRQPPQKHK